MSDGDLDWFYALSVADRLTLLRDPRGDLPGPLMSRLSQLGPGLVKYHAYFVASQAPSSRPKLVEDAARSLEEHRDELMRELDA